MTTACVICHTRIVVTDGVRAPRYCSRVCERIAAERRRRRRKHIALSALAGVLLAVLLTFAGKALPEPDSGPLATSSPSSTASATVPVVPVATVTISPTVTHHTPTTVPVVFDTPTTAATATPRLPATGSGGLLGTVTP